MRRIVSLVTELLLKIAPTIIPLVIERCSKRKDQVIDKKGEQG